jgi:hypothetical protein
MRRSRSAIGGGRRVSQSRRNCRTKSGLAGTMAGLLLKLRVPGSFKLFIIPKHLPEWQLAGCQGYTWSIGGTEGLEATSIEGVWAECRSPAPVSCRVQGTVQIRPEGRAVLVGSCTPRHSGMHAVHEWQVAVFEVERVRWVGIVGACKRNENRVFLSPSSGLSIRPEVKCNGRSPLVHLASPGPVEIPLRLCSKQVPSPCFDWVSKL